MRISQSVKDLNHRRIAMKDTEKAVHDMNIRSYWPFGLNSARMAFGVLRT